MQREVFHGAHVVEIVLAFQVCKQALGELRVCGHDCLSGDFVEFHCGPPGNQFGDTTNMIDCGILLYTSFNSFVVIA